MKLIRRCKPESADSRPVLARISIWSFSVLLIYCSLSNASAAASSGGETPDSLADEQLSRLQAKVHSNEDSQNDLDSLITLVERFPRYARARLILSIYLQNQGYEELARDELEKAIALSPMYKEAHYRYCALLFRMQKRNAALAQLERCRILSRGDGKSLYKLAVMAERFGMSNEAQYLYEEAFQCGSSARGLAASLASMRLSQGKLDEAMLLVDQELATNPDSSIPNMIKGEILDLQGRSQDSLAYFRRAYLISPCEREAASLTADKLLSVSAYKEALQAALSDVECAALDPRKTERVKARLLLLLARVSENDSQSLIDICSQKLAAEPAKARFYHLLLGDVYDRKGMPFHAMIQYRKGLSYVQPPDPCMRARGLFRLGLDEYRYAMDYQSALRNFSEARNLAPDDKEIEQWYFSLERRLSSRNLDFAWKLKDAVRRFLIRWTVPRAPGQT